MPANDLWSTRVRNSPGMPFQTMYGDSIPLADRIVERKEGSLNNLKCARNSKRRFISGTLFRSIPNVSDRINIHCPSSSQNVHRPKPLSRYTALVIHSRTSPLAQYLSSYVSVSSSSHVRPPDDSLTVRERHQPRLRHRQCEHAHLFH